MVSSKWSKSEKGQVYTQDASLFTSMTGCRASVGAVTQVRWEDEAKTFLYKGKALPHTGHKSPLGVGVTERALLTCEVDVLMPFARSVPGSLVLGLWVIFTDVPLLLCTFQIPLILKGSVAMHILIIFKFSGLRLRGRKWGVSAGQASREVALSFQGLQGPMRCPLSGPRL